VFAQLDSCGRRNNLYRCSTSGTSGVVVTSVDGANSQSAPIDTAGNAIFTEGLANLAAGAHLILANYTTPGGDVVSQPTTVTITGTSVVSATVYQFQITQPDLQTSGYAPNGDIKAYVDSVNGTWSGITYDPLNRLIGAQQVATGSSNTEYFCWTYDGFGNRTMQASSSSSFQGGSTPCQNSAPTTTYAVSYNANNQITQTPFTIPAYDLAGNIISDDNNQYLYDDEGQVCAVKSPPLSPGGSIVMTQYLYDAEGRRVGKGSIQSWSCDATINGFNLTNSYILDLSGDQVTETDGTGQWLHTNVFVGGNLLATYDTNGVHYHIDDWLGSRRVQTDYLGRVESTYQNLPFGELVPNNNTMFLGATEHHFTGKERDLESGNDYMFARYDNSATGRFLSPDWSAKHDPVPYAKLDNPQSLNLYSYVYNNPINGIDPDGHFASPWHIALTLAAALSTGDNPFSAFKLAIQVAWFDKGTQGADQGWLHSMGTKGESRSSAYGDAEFAVYAEEALGDPAAELHTVQDSYALGHGYKPWSNYHDLGVGGTIEHEIGDWLPSPGRVWGAFRASRRALKNKHASPESVLAPLAGGSSTDPTSSSDVPSENETQGPDTSGGPNGGVHDESGEKAIMCSKGTEAACGS
jgi:RHS repeat-associated protein